MPRRRGSTCGAARGTTHTVEPFDLLIIGGGINGAGIARDAAGRGLRVALADAGDLGGATSSASTKLIHGGLRYLEFYQFGLVRKALAERETLLDIAPHLTWPQSFVLPHAPEARPEWMLRAGTWLYDHLARRDVVPGSERIDLRHDRAGRPLQPQFRSAFRYWDGWVDDARLVIANAQDVRARGGTVMPRTRVTRAIFADGVWTAALDHGGTVTARYIVNAAGPWAEEVARTVLGLNDAPALRLVQGSHLVTRRVHLGRDAFMLQQPDGRIVFVIPYERDFSLIGTTEHGIDTPGAVAVSDAEADYLLAAVNRYLVRPLTPADIVHRFAGVRPLILEAGKGDRETSRDFTLVNHGVPALTVVGGKITTYRILAEAVMKVVAPKTRQWTATAPLPGGDIPRHGKENGQTAFKRWLGELMQAHENYDPQLIRRLAHTLGTAAEPLLAAGLGDNLGGVFEAELAHFRDVEWATTAADVLWRRTKLGLHLDAAAKARVAAWFGEAAPADDGIDAARHRFAVPRLA